MPVLDTTVLVDLMRPRAAEAHRRALAFVNSARGDGKAISTTRINVAELLVGVELADDRLDELQRVQDVLEEIAILDLDQRAAQRFGYITARLQRLGRPVSDLDVLIASIALANGQSLVTRNARHFAEIPGLQLESY
jgi:tRNA(fMet)-specific endonuclease VapC